MAEQPTAAVDNADEVANSPVVSNSNNDIAVGINPIEQQADDDNDGEVIISGTLSKPIALLANNTRCPESVRYRVLNESRRGKPARSTCPLWKFFMVYTSDVLSGIAVCKLCEANGDLGDAEVRYSSPTHLRQHLDTKKRKGHREALKEHEESAAAAAVAAVAAVAAATAAAAAAAKGGVGGGGGGSGGAVIGENGAGTAMMAFMDDVKPFTRKIVRFIIGSQQPFSVVENAAFMDCMFHLEKDVSIPSKGNIVRAMEEIQGVLLSQLVARLEGQYVSVTADWWAPCAGDTYQSFTVSLVDDRWDMKTFSLDCSKATGSARRGEDIAESVIAQVMKHKLEGRVVAFTTTDCSEPSMVKAGRLVGEAGVAEHHGCCSNRLGCTTGVLFDWPGVRETIALARLLVRRYTASKQAAQQLEESLDYVKAPKRKVIPDEETKWWTTHTSLERLLHLRSAINIHEIVIAGSSDTASARILSDTRWSVVEHIVAILEPFMSVQRVLEAEKHVAVSLVVPNIMELRVGLRAAIEELRAVPPAGTPAHQLEARSIVLPGADALVDDFHRRWGDGTTSVLNVKAGSQQQQQQQPGGFKRWQLVATALDWRTKNVLFGFNDDEKEELWELVVRETVELVLEEGLAQPAAPAAAAAPAHIPATPEVPGGEAPAPASPPPKKPRLSGFMAATQSQPVAGGGDDNAETSSFKRASVAHAVRAEVASFRKSGGMLMFQEKADADGLVTEVYNNPLDMWREKAAEFPYLARIARRVLAIPATQAQSQRMFSAAGLLDDGRRGSLDPESLELLVFLRCNWTAVEEWHR